MGYICIRVYVLIYVLYGIIRLVIGSIFTSSIKDSAVVEVVDARCLFTILNSGDNVTCNNFKL